MNPQLAKGISWLEAATPERRIIVLVAACLVGILLWLQLFLLPLTGEISTNKKQVIALQEQVSKIETQTHDIVDQATRPVTPETVKENEELKKQLAEVDTQLGEKWQTVGASSGLMNTFKTLVSSSSGLTITNLQDKHSTVKSSNIQQHNITLEFTGNYFDTINFLKKLESSPWYFFNDEFNYQVTKYPQAKTTIKLHTISV